MPKIIIDMPKDEKIFKEFLKLILRGKEEAIISQYRSQDLFFLPTSQIDLLTKEARPNIAKVVVLTEN